MGTSTVMGLTLIQNYLRAILTQSMHDLRASQRAHTRKTHTTARPNLSLLPRSQITANVSFIEGH